MEEIRYQIIRSARKTAAIQIRNAQVIVRCPYGTKDAWIREFVERKAHWIQSHLQSHPKAQKLTDRELSELKKLTKEKLPPLVSAMAARMGVTYGQISIRAQKTRWGSCSAKGNLNFNCLLMLVPEAVREYVLIHELCHRKQLNHSPAFWSLVQAQMPDYREKRAWLKTQGRQLIDRL